MTETLGAGTVIASRYTVVQVLGQGGMAVVYEVMNHQLGVPCALKVLTLTARSVRSRLQREGQVQASLAHPNVVTVFDVVDVDGCPGLLMELVRGPPLDVLLAEQRLTIEQCDALARGIFAGLEAAHERGLIHRDLKPANILCSVANGQLIPKIADFGLAKIVGDESGAANLGATKSGTTMGTPSYMAPEQIRAANKVDTRADLFSLGAILYEMVCGRRAFDGDDLLDLFTAVAAGKYTPPRELRPDLPERMERAILAALAPNREERVRDVASLAAVWSGERDDWTTEIDPAQATITGTWDVTLLQRYRSGGVSSGDTGATTGGALTPMSPSARGPVSGATYTEEVARKPSIPPSKPTPLPTRSRRPLIALVAAALLLVFGASGAVGVAFFVAVGPHLGPALEAWSSPAPEPEAPPPPDPQPEPVAPDEQQVGVVAVVPEVQPAAPQGPPPATAGSVAPPSARHVAPEPPPPAPDPEPVEVAPAEPPPPDTTVRVATRGDARSVFLQTPQGPVALPGALPPGTYPILAYFPGSEVAVQAGSVRLELGRAATVSCSAMMRTCK